MKSFYHYYDDLQSSKPVRVLRYVLLPLSVLYAMMISIRNWLFDKKIIKSARFNFPIICVGNLATGGTGKTPLTEYIVQLLQNKYKAATLSRGYKRKTKGFAIANANTTAIDIGDEPMQLHKKFPSVVVAVGEERVVAIPQILHDRPDTEVIILDDAFQHRVVSAGLNLLLTDFEHLYTRDLLLPAGNLRDLPSSARRSDVIIVTKSKRDLSEHEKQKLIIELKPLTHQKVFFTELVYAQPYHLFSNKPGVIRENTEVLLLCGIANPKPLLNFLSTQVKSYHAIKYADHHIFTSDDLKEIKRSYDDMTSAEKIIITTEKDAVRLEKYKADLADFPLYILPVAHRFLFNEAPLFEELILRFVDSYKPKV